MLGGFGLNREDVLEFTIEDPGPELCSIRGVNQLRNNSHLVPLFSHSAFQKRAHPQFFPNRFGFLLPVFETKGRTATDDLEVSDLTQGGDQFFRQPVGKIFVARITAFIKKRQHRNRFLCTRCRRLAVSRRCISSRITSEKKQTDRQKSANENDVDPRTAE